MKVALCYSGHLGRVVEAARSHRRYLMTPEADYDIFAYTSDSITQKDNNKLVSKKLGQKVTTNHNLIYKVPNSDIQLYLPADQGWRNNTRSYGIIYKIGVNTAKRALIKAYGKDVIYKIEKEDLSKDQANMTKFEWLKMNQWYRVYRCHNMMEKHAKKKEIKYDIVVKSRFDVALSKKANMIANFKKHNAGEKDILFVFGGWKNGRFMDKFLFDGFMYGNPRVMKLVSELHLLEESYSPKKEYMSWFKKYGDNSEYQVFKHMEAHGVEISFINNRRGYTVLRK